MTDLAAFSRIVRDPAGRVRLTPQPRAAVALALEPGNYWRAQAQTFHERLLPLCTDEAPSRGRLALLDGPPGGGKTYLARGLLHATPAVPWVRTDPAMFLTLTEGELADLADATGNWGPRVLFIEDADKLIATRTEANQTTLATLLNLGDGMLGIETNWRVLLSTNMAFDAIDPAVQRPGRLAVRMHFGLLGAPQAEAVYVRLTGRRLPVLRAQMLAAVYGLAARVVPSPA